MNVAAIDCGTNSVRVLILGPDGRELTRRMQIVRLGEGVDATGRLAPAALARTQTALAEFAAEIKAVGVARTRVVATSATRDASNADEFHAMVLATLGVAPEVVSGDEEARLAFTGALAGLDVSEPPYLLVDIGGGSTEFVHGSTSVEHAISTDIGSVRMTERHLHSDPPELDEIEAAAADIGAVVAGALAVVPPGRTLVGVAGTITTVAAIALGLTAYDRSRIHQARITAEEVRHVTAGLAEMTREQRLGITSMHPGRADVIVGGALILRTIMEQTGAESILVSEHDILDGIAASLST
ncbi:exopolyphosphatase/guanosine-5'-triphosphate,3'-diphosphate pyrophosphatase [Allocatelliglobosispora scoriae]|uniref:Exopolyphosphatase/guanosine-5'-triphosphate, 3'-diphosphate pyrophosphatase n=1 Tax=Allocatelliglobosispora scoriae TaxID=643052 RepID=A0A841BTZ9_9ACTN|nr:Ppx/GppA phosphatase family protein [Allocatelliglobosispora scoriae]MBB5870383.1 exopolyphosphatase/guanosine-5'-triphosphate,3'-diphosphate pyrophosphatase [Allocatelliglobosispora scoriae]